MGPHFGGIKLDATCVYIYMGEFWGIVLIYNSRLLGLVSYFMAPGSKGFSQRSWTSFGKNCTTPPQPKTTCTPPPGNLFSQWPKKRGTVWDSLYTPKDCHLSSWRRGSGSKNSPRHPSIPNLPESGWTDSTWTITGMDWFYRSFDRSEGVKDRNALRKERNMPGGVVGGCQIFWGEFFFCPNIVDRKEDFSRQNRVGDSFYYV